MSADGVFNRLSSVFCSTMISRAFCAQAILHFTGGTRENWNTVSSFCSSGALQVIHSL